MLESASGGCFPGPGGAVCLVLGGSVWSQGGLPGPGGVCLVRGVSLVRGDVSLVLGGLPGPGGWHPSMHWGRHPPPPFGQTHTCKNITLATTSLRPVIMDYKKVQYCGLKSSSNSSHLINFRCGWALRSPHCLTVNFTKCWQNVPWVFAYLGMVTSGWMPSIRGSGL